MSIDRVKALKLETTIDGSVTDMTPRECNPVQDYLATKGVAFENLDTFLIDKVGRSIVELFPSLYQQVTYVTNDPTIVEFFNSSSFITANRVARYDLSYTSFNLTSEVLKIYDTDGSTILRTYTWTHTYSSNDYVSSGLVIT